MTRTESPRIALIVEGDIDKVVLEELLSRIATEENLQRPQYKTVRLNGSPSTKYFIPELRQLQDQGYQHILLVFDTDHEDENTLLEHLQGKLQRAGFEERVELIPVTPSIEAWLLADAQALAGLTGQSLPEGLPPREALQRAFGDRPKLQLIKDLAKRLRISVLRQKDRAFQRFESSIREALLPHPA